MNEHGITGDTATSASVRIIEEVTSWPGVEVHRGSRGELSVRLGRREIGHLHGDRVVHFGFPVPIWTELMTQRRVGPHPLDQPGWAERRIEEPGDVPEVIELFRLNYARVLSRHGLPANGEAHDDVAP